MLLGATKVRGGHLAEASGLTAACFRRLVLNTNNTSTMTRHLKAQENPLMRFWWLVAGWGTKAPKSNPEGSRGPEKGTI